MRVLVTGATGLVGSAIAFHLAEAGHEVVGLSRHASPALPDTVLQVEADISAASFLERITARVTPCEAIVHAAAARNTQPDLPLLTMTNYFGTEQTLALAQVWGCRRFIYLSGVAVIGRPTQVPITEDHPVNPGNIYLASKLYGEYLVAMAARDGLPGVTLRLSAPIGPAMPRSRILAIFIDRALKDLPLEVNGQGTRRQNYVDVRDVAKSVQCCLSSPAQGIFNIGGAEAVSNLELARHCIRILGAASSVSLSGNPDPEDDVRWELSIEKAAEAFGYRPECSIEASIRAIADAYRQA